jgi:hypothetical protein
MTLENLRFLIYEVGRRLQFKEVYIIGSAAIAATVPNPPEGELTATRDVDVIPPGDTESLMDQIDQFMGEGSAFDEQRGYYAQGVSSKTPEMRRGTGSRARSLCRPRPPSAGAWK